MSMRVFSFVYTYVLACACASTNVSVCIRECVHVFPLACVCLCLSVFACIFVFVCVCVCVCACVRAGGKVDSAVESSQVNTLLNLFNLRRRALTDGHWQTSTKRNVCVLNFQCASWCEKKRVEAPGSTQRQHPAARWYDSVGSQLQGSATRAVTVVCTPKNGVWSREDRSVAAPALRRNRYGKGRGGGTWVAMGF